MPKDLYTLCSARDETPATLAFGILGRHQHSANLERVSIMVRGPHGVMV